MILPEENVYCVQMVIECEIPRGYMVGDWTDFEQRLEDSDEWNLIHPFEKATRFVHVVVEPFVGMDSAQDIINDVYDIFRDALIYGGEG